MKRHHRMRVVGGGKTVAMIPRWLRPGLTRQSIIDLGLAHWQNLDALHRGEGTPAIMWQVGGGVLTWSRVADLIRRGQPEMQAQVELFDRVVEHWKATGRVEWPNHDDYQLARDGAIVMDELARVVDAHTALQAAIWSEERINDLERNTLQEMAHHV